jgi:DNA-binding XRE family transcriptional regulator
VDVAGVSVTDATCQALTCVECGAVDLSLDDVQRYERRAAATVLRATERPTGQLVRYARRALGLTQAELAEKLGAAGETVSRWEGEKAPIPRYLAPALTGWLDEVFLAPTQRDASGLLRVPACATCAA